MKITLEIKVEDNEGGFARMVNWGHPGSDITGMLARSEKVAGTCEELLGGEVYHYHSKLMMKDAETGGKYVWHQDYGIDHDFIAGQTGADVERVNAIAKICPLEFVELEPGDALFFHCNLLQTSNQNKSPYRRWAFLCAYNRASNNPIKKHHHPSYTKLHKVGNKINNSNNNKDDSKQQQQQQQQ
ncbi:hypothetical protein KUTeg_022487 [Tegillarca granosa]|uniref:Uncharacterized protein n=1 Tax=Tegillarca granosa TaxID=220873 RepID=A0ABQ9E6C5_TEGGR|nr:hypothetical protein KUTeg_022487 [Tegillarca granosa]